MDRIENAEDILSESLEFLGGEQAVDDGQVCYGPLSLTVAPKASMSHIIGRAYRLELTRRSNRKGR